MRVIIAGSRHMPDSDAVLIWPVVELFSQKYGAVTEVVCGCAKGADTLGEQWAIENNITVKRFPADWNKHGKAAGPIRNNQMAEYAEGLIAFLYPESRGTRHMISAMEKRNKPIIVVELK